MAFDSEQPTAESLSGVQRIVGKGEGFPLAAHLGHTAACFARQTRSLQRYLQPCTEGCNRKCQLDKVWPQLTCTFCIWQDRPCHSNASSVAEPKAAAGLRLAQLLKSKQIIVLTRHCDDKI